ncbi:MAG: hypothetical protein K0S11_1026 [Gammaproteobacteria bacterium]|jgi:hypothetical protein|nr:hypothetical protein [Gammaproteobacteria bacterium]
MKRQSNSLSGAKVDNENPSKKFRSNEFQGRVYKAIEILREKELYFSKPSVVNKLHERAIETYPEHAVTIAYAISDLKFHKIINKSNIEAVTEAKSNARGVAQALGYLAKLNYSHDFVKDCYGIIITHSDKAASLAKCMELLEETVNKEIVDNLFEQVRDTKKIYKALEEAKKIQAGICRGNPDDDRKSDIIFCQPVIIAICKQPDTASELVKTLSYLSSKDYIERLCEDPQQALAIAKGLVELGSSYCNKSVENKSVELIFKHPEHANGLAKAIKSLRREQLCSNLALKVIENHPDMAEAIGSCLVNLAQQGINKDNRKPLWPLLQNQPQEIIQAFKILLEAKALNQTSFNIICEKSNYGIDLAKAMVKLTSADDKRLNIIGQHANQAELAADILISLGRREYKDIDIYERLTEIEPRKIYVGILALSKNKLLTEENLQLLLNNPEHANGIGRAFATLNKADLYDHRKLIVEKKAYTKTIAASLEILYYSGKLDKDNLKKICEKPVNSLFIAEEIKGNEKTQYSNAGEKDFNTIREFSRFFAQIRRKGTGPFSVLPEEILKKIAADCGPYGSLEEEVANHIAFKSFDIKPS